MRDALRMGQLPVTHAAPPRNQPTQLTWRTSMSGNRIVRRLAGTALIGAVALALAGCGSSGSSSPSSSAGTTTGAAAKTPGTETGQTDTPAGSAAQGTTKPDTKLALGTPATVSYQPGGKGPKYALKVTAISITKAPKSDFNGVELEKAQQEQTPFYVKLSVRNEGAGNAAAETGNPTVGFSVMDDRGQPAQELTLLGTFRPCNSTPVPKEFTRGVTYTTCNVYMVGGSGSIKSVSWTGSGADEYSEHPIVWADE